ncbi:hypothetical protein ACFPYI_01765 [Halomarina salina]|uniref:DUF8156 domain-containing protein n=1 Tax=Halomarina salina TaxID=1872699 RepID=A0ABD5RHL6_9EURY|nr:hypothetical protein [Halomarina salina]
MERDWTDYRRALRRRQQPVFDDLWRKARTHADAGGMLNHSNPMTSAMLSMLLEQQREINELRDRVDEDTDTGSSIDNS